MDHGFCTNEKGFANECICYPGWSGPNCTECVKYPGKSATLKAIFPLLGINCTCHFVPGCPAEGTCNEPWECNCADGVEGKYCNHTVKHNLLPEYYHHHMSLTCRQLNRELTGRTDRTVH